jgi:hypothetical protein
MGDPPVGFDKEKDTPWVSREDRGSVAGLSQKGKICTAKTQRTQRRKEEKKKKEERRKKKERFYCKKT